MFFRSILLWELNLGNSRCPPLKKPEKLMMFSFTSNSNMKLGLSGSFGFQMCCLFCMGLDSVQEKLSLKLSEFPEERVIQFPEIKC